MSDGNLTVRAEVRLRNAKMIDARKQHGLSQISVADASNVPLPHIAALEKMDYSRPSTRRYAKRVADFLDLPTEDVLPEGIEEALPNKLIIDREIKISALLESRASFENRMILPSPDKAVEMKEATAQIFDVLDTLTYRERSVIKMRFGLNGGYVHTLDEIGQHQNCSRERIRQIEEKALRKLRHPVRMGRLANIIDVEE